VLNPIVSSLVDYVPDWIAPNVIVSEENRSIFFFAKSCQTLLGLALLTTAAFVSYLHSPGLHGALPIAVYKLCALSIFLYQTL
jgi:hypothetical protein